MKTLTSQIKEGKTCLPPYVPESKKLHVDEIQNAYDELAMDYDKKVWLDQHILGVARQRRQLMSKAHGRILDVACGTGSNFSMFPSSSEITAIDLSPQMLEIAQRKARELKLNIHVLVMDAQKLDFPDGTFHTVVSALSTCTFPDPIQTLREMKRVCRADGSILLLEHGHSSMAWLANYQDRHVLPHYEQHAGCRWNQDPLDMAKAAGLEILSSKRFGLGMFHAIVAR
jgi:ubiquinone/menaquinone biosynthesis C-methylase UbiE